MLMLMLGLMLGLAEPLGALRHAQPGQSKAHRRKQHRVQRISLIPHAPALAAIIAIHHALGLDQQQNRVVIRLAGITYTVEEQQLVSE